MTAMRYWKAKAYLSSTWTTTARIWNLPKWRVLLCTILLQRIRPPILVVAANAYMNCLAKVNASKISRTSSAKVGNQLRNRPMTILLHLGFPKREAFKVIDSFPWGNQEPKKKTIKFNSNTSKICLCFKRKRGRANKGRIRICFRLTVTNQWMMSRAIHLLVLPIIPIAKVVQMKKKINKSFKIF